MGFLRDLFGPLRPCDLCQIGRSSWPTAHNAVADWKLRSEDLQADFLVCGRCRNFLQETGNRYRHPVVALAAAHAAGIADEPNPWAYMNHPEWRKVWTQILATEGKRFTNEAQVLMRIHVLSESFMQGALAEVGKSNADEERDEDKRRLAATLGVAPEVVEVKYASYALALGLGDRESDWNDEIDDFGREIGALTTRDIEAARTDSHRAVLNRIKVAIVAERQGAGDGGEAPASPEREGHVSVPGGPAEIEIPRVSFAHARSESEFERLILTAVSGAANLLVPIVLERAGGALSLPTARGCALDMVEKGYEGNLAPSRDTDGLLVAGRTMFETLWREWGRQGDPLETLLHLYDDGD